MNFVKASNYWKNKVKNVAPSEVILDAAYKILSGYRHCTIATGSASGVDATPVHYIFLDNNIYIFSEGGEKFSHMAQNLNVCISVFNHNGDFGNIHSVQAYGKAEFVDVLSDEYMKVVENSVYKLNAAYLEKRAESGEPLYLIKVNPNRYKVTDSDFKKNNYDINQCYEREVVKC